MSIHKIEMPPEIYYGANALEKVGEVAQRLGSRALIVGDQVMEELGNVQKVADLLATSGVESASYLGANTEPTDTFVDEALSVYQENNCDVIISIGGGSCIDTAKALAVVATNGGYIGDYFGNKKVADKPSVPLIIIPTTAGTGSEVTNVTVITNTHNNVKMMIKHYAFLPRVAIVDPVLTMTSPGHVTAAAGLDALCHAIESYVSRIAHPMTQIFSLDAAKLILNNIQQAYDDPNNTEARTNMAIGALQAGVAFSNASVTLIHGMSRPVGAVFHVPHGISNTMLLPAYLEFIRDVAEEDLAYLTRYALPEETQDKSDKEAVDFLIQKTKELSNHMDVPNMKEWGIDQTEFEANIDKMTSDAIESGSPAYTPRIPTADEIKELYRYCYDYDFSA